MSTIKNSSAIGTTISSSPIFTGTAVATTANITSAIAGGTAGQILTTGTGYASWIAPQYVPSDPLILNGQNNKEIVRLTKDGDVVWAANINVDEAAAALNQAFVMSMEMKAGITDKLKNKIRDTVFEEIIEVANRKGVLTASELTLMLEASKIMEKLKGI